MFPTNISPRSVRVIRWIARIWSILVFLLAIIIIFIPTVKNMPVWKPYSVAMDNAFLLSLFSVSLLGLMIAWRWEAAGALMTLTCTLVQQVAFWVFENIWWWIQVLPVLFLAMPAILFLIAWELDVKAKEAKQNHA